MVWFEALASATFNTSERVHSYTLAEGKGKDGKGKGKGKKVLLHVDGVTRVPVVRLCTVEGRPVWIIVVQPDAAASVNNKRRGTTTGTVVLYAHGRGEDLGHLAKAGTHGHGRLRKLANAVGAPVVAFEYPGYGHELADRVSYAGVVQRMAAAFRALASTHDRVVVYGYSIGAGVALAGLRRSAAAAAAASASTSPRPPTPLPAAVVLEGAFASLLRSVPARTGAGGVPAALLRRLRVDAFENRRTLRELVKIAPSLPFLFVHGEDDDMCPAADAKKMAADAGAAAKALWVPERGHYDAWRDRRYTPFLRRNLCPDVAGYSP